MTFKVFMLANNAPVLVEVDDRYIDLIANATGFSASKITVLCNEIPQFVPIEEDERSISDYLQIIITVLILALLGFVVFRSTRSKKVKEEIQPELSVDALLESTAEAAVDPLDDIDYNEKSEQRVLIEKFVDENPDAVALLLRNWLNEPSSRGSSQPRDQTHVSYVFCIGRQVLYHYRHLRSPGYSPASAAAKSRQSCLTLCDPIDGSPPGHGFNSWLGN